MKVTSPAVRSMASGTRSGHLHGSKPEAQPLRVAFCRRSAQSARRYLTLRSSLLKGGATLNYKSATRLRALTAHRRHEPGHLTCTVR